MIPIHGKEMACFFVQIQRSTSSWCTLCTCIGNIILTRYLYIRFRLRCNIRLNCRNRYPSSKKELTRNEFPSIGWLPACLGKDERHQRSRTYTSVWAIARAPPRYRGYVIGNCWQLAAQYRARMAHLYGCKLWGGAANSGPANSPLKRSLPEYSAVILITIQWRIAVTLDAVAAKLARKIATRLYK